MKTATLLFFLLPLFASAQITLTGNVVDKKTGERISFASVGLMKENIGTSADENGSFRIIAVHPVMNDSIVCSSIGYQTLIVPVTDAKIGNFTLALLTKEEALEGIFVKNKKYLHAETLNDFSSCGNNYLTSAGYQIMIAQHFTAPEDQNLLSKVKICRLSLPPFSPEKTIFRLRIYSMDSISKGPGEELSNSIIEVKSKRSVETISLDKYHIHIPDRDFFVAIEWLMIPYNEVHDKQKMPDGNTKEYIHYRPSLGYSDNYAEPLSIWMLDFKNVWRPITLRESRAMSIAVTVKY